MRWPDCVYGYGLREGIGLVLGLGGRGMKGKPEMFFWRGKVV